MISTPSYPASRANVAARANAFTVRSMSAAVISRGVCREIGARTAEAETRSGLGA